MDDTPCVARLCHALVYCACASVCVCFVSLVVVRWSSCTWSGRDAKLHETRLRVTR